MPIPPSASWRRAKQAAEAMLNSTGTDAAPLPLLPDARKAKRKLEQVADAVFIDGQLSRGERKLLSRYATHFELSAADVKLIVRETRPGFTRRHALRRVERYVRQGGRSGR